MTGADHTCACGREYYLSDRRTSWVARCACGEPIFVPRKRAERDDCKAKHGANDQIECLECGVRWDASDRDPPPCPRWSN